VIYTFYAMSKKQIPFDFVLEAIESRAPYTKPMFGAVGVYVDEKIVFILREREKHTEDNGVWLATTGEHHASLSEELPSMRSIKVFGPGPTGWQVLPSEADDFEESVLRACEMVLNDDPRIGKIPKSRQRKGPPRAKKKAVAVKSVRRKK
jgi:hypothetical protein